MSPGRVGRQVINATTTSAAPKVIGDPKAGLALRIRQTPDRMSLEGRPDPLALYVVIAAAVAVGLLGALALSPREGLVSFLTFSLVFSPLICVLAFNALRVKTRCVIDAQLGTVQIDEQSSTRHVQEVHPIDEVEAVVVRRLQAAPLAGSPWSTGLFLRLRDADYLAACSTDEAMVSQDAWRIARFLGVPVEAAPEEPERRGSQTVLLLTTILIYLLPIALAAAVLLLAFDRVPEIEPWAALLGAVVISQIGAMVAFAYYRTRRPYEV